MTNYVVSAGQTASGLVLSAGDTLEVKSGGLATGTVVSGADNVTVDSGGTTSGTVFTSGGTEYVSGRATGTVLSGNAEEVVYSGGTASGTTANSGYIQTYGGDVLGATVGSGGTLYDYGSGTVSGTTVDSGGTLQLEGYYYGSAVATGTVLSGGTEYVYGGATASGTTVANGGTEYVYSGGIASGTTVLSGGTQHVSGGGTEAGTTVDSGGTQTIQHFYVVSAGQTASGLVLSAGDTLEVMSGGLATGTVVNGAATVTVDSGGTTSGTVFTSGGTEYVSGTADGTALGGYASEVVYSGGAASGTTLASGYIEAYGGDVLGATVGSGGTLYDYGSGTVSGTTVDSGGTLQLEGYYYGSAVATGTVLSGGTEYVYGGATASGTTVANGGTEYVYSGGIASGTTVLSGGTQHVSGGGTEAGTTVDSGGTQTIQHFYVVSSGQTASGLVLSAGDTLEVMSGGLATGTVVNGAATVTVDSGGTTSGTDFTSGGTEYVSGTATGTVLSGNASEVVYSGGAASGTTANSGYIETYGGDVQGATVGSGGALYDYGSGTVSGTTVDSGGTIQLEPVYAVAVATTGTVLSGGTEYVYGGATASGTTVATGGIEYVYASGTASGTIVLSGGLQHVYGDGTESGTTVASGGTQTIQHFYVVNAGQSVSGLVLNPGDTLEVKSGGLATGTVVNGAGTVTVDSGGSTSGTTFTSGGTEYVSGTAEGTVLGSYASEIVYSGGAASGTMLTSGYIETYGGDVLGAAVGSGGTLYDYGSGTVSGTTVGNGGTIQLEGYYYGSAVAIGTVLSGGTEYVYGGATASGTTVASGGTEYVYSGGIASGTTVLSGGTLDIYGGGTDIGTVVSSGGTQRGGSAGPIWVTLSTPTSATIGETGYVEVTYQNMGLTPVTAPIIDLSSDGALISPYGSSGAGSSDVTFLGTGYSDSAGVLAPGESETAYFNYTPTGTVAGTTFNFSVGALNADQPLDLTDLKTSLKPANVDQTDWNNVWSAFQAQVGTTTTSFDAALAGEATELANAGQPTGDVPTLIQDEILQAGGGLQPSPLASATDLAGPGSLASLLVSRTYDGTLLTRDAPGLFGTGWTSPYDISAITDASGDVTITTPAGVQVFTMQPDGTYASEAGDADTLTVADGVTTLTSSSGTVTQFLASGKLGSITDASGNVITAHWTASGALGSVTSSDGETITFTTNAAGKITGAADSNGQSVSYSYDATGTRLLGVTGPSGTTSYAYRSASGTLADGALSTVTAPDGTQESFSYDAQGRLTSQSGSNGAGAVTYSYPSPGTVVETDALGNATTLLYNTQGQIASATDTTGNAVQLGYDANGKLTSTTSAVGTSSYDYDSSGNLIYYTDPSGASVYASYAPGTHELTSVTDGNYDTIDYSYDAAGHVTGVTYADSSGTTYKYASDGLLSSSTDAEGHTTSFVYDAVGNLTKESFADGTSQSYVYDATGNLTSATATDGDLTAYAYNAAHQLTGVTDANNRLETYAYNAAGQLSQRTEPDGSVTTYSYDADGRLSSLHDGTGTLIESYTYDAANQLTRELKGNGTSTAYSYDAAGRVIDILNVNADGSTGSDNQYNYNAASEISKAVTNDGIWTYGYNAASELTEADFASTNPSIQNQALSYTYDAAGNRTTSTDNGIVTNYTINALNQYTAVGGTTYAYDADGNMTSATDATGTITYTWNDVGQLVGATSPTDTTTYKYDGLGNLIGSSSNGVSSSYLIDPLAIVGLTQGGLSAIAQSYGSTGQVSGTFDYGFGGLIGVTSSAGLTYYNFDEQGNLSGVSDTSGKTEDSFVNDPYGNVISGTVDSEPAMTFEGQFGGLSTEDLVNLRERYYDPAIGRFISPDPTNIDGGLNFYRYSANNPVNAIDPDGLSQIFINIGAAFAYLGGAGVSAGIVLTTSNKYGLPDIGWYDTQSANVGWNAAGVSLQVGYDSRDYSSFQGYGQSVNGNVGYGAGSIILDNSTNKPVGGSLGIGTPGIGFDYSNSVTTTHSFFEDVLIPSLKGFFSSSQSVAVNSVSPVSQDNLPKNSAGAFGCPHFTTFDGQNFDFQGAGEFVAAKSTVPGDTFQVQMRVEPEGSSDSSVSIITQIAVQVGADRVTFGVPQYNDAARPQVVWVDGKPSTIDETNPVLTLDGGTVTEISSNEYQVALKTGEVVTVNPFGDGMGFNVALAPDAAPGSVQGFLGPDTGQANDFSLPDGTVLKQLLTQDQLYHQFADAWRVTDATSLLDYDSGQTTATFTDTQYPREILTLADFPADLVAKALALASAAGITDPTLAKDAAFDYISMGNPSFFSEDATVAGHNPTTATEATIIQTTTPDPSIGILPASPTVTESKGTTTTVAFSVNLTSAATTDTVVDYAVTPNVDYLTNTAGKTFFTAADFGGTLPSGSVTIKAGQTEADVTVDVPNGALGSAPGKWLGISITTPGDDPIYDPTAQAEVLNNAPVAGSPAVPTLKLLAGATSSTGTTPPLTQNGNSYTLDLGQVTGGTSLPLLKFALANTAAVGSDSLVGQILTTTGSGFTVSGSQPSTAILAGSSYSGLSLQPLTTALGDQSETITFSATDTNSSGYSANLPNITLVVKDTVVAPSPTSTATLPVITGTVAGQTTTAEAPIKPFAKVSVADTNAGATDALTITLAGAGGTLTGTGLTGGNGGVYTLSAASPTTLTAELDALSFVAAGGSPGTTTTTTFTLVDASSAGTNASDNTTTVTDKAAPAPVTPTPPVITGTVAGQTTTAEAPIKPFAKVSILDTNAGATDELTITLSGAGGTLTGTGLTGGTGGVYTLSAASPTTLTAELDALGFVAAAGSPGMPSTTAFALLASSTAGTSTSDKTTTVIDTVAPATVTPTPPVITGTLAGQTTTAEATIRPFANVSIADANAGATDALTISLSGGGGTLTGTGLTGGTGGVYTLSAVNPITLTAELDGLSFAAIAGAAGAQTTTTFTISDASSAGTSAADATTTVIDTTSAASTGPGTTTGAGGTTTGSGGESATGSIPTAIPTDTGSTAGSPGAGGAGSGTDIILGLPTNQSPSPAPADTVSLDPSVAYQGHGTFVLTGKATSPLGVADIEISAQVDGAPTDLGAALLNRDGTFTFTDHVGAHTQVSLTATETDGAGGTTATQANYDLQAGITETGSFARQDSYGADGSTVVSRVAFQSNGERFVDVGARGQTVDLQPFDIVFNHGKADTQFVFHPGDELDAIRGFKVGGPGHDTLELPSSDFRNIADVLRNTGDIGGSAFITDPVTGDAIRLAGVTTAELKAHPKDFVFQA